MQETSTLAQIVPPMLAMGQREVPEQVTPPKKCLGRPLVDKGAVKHNNYPPFNLRELPVAILPMPPWRHACRQYALLYRYPSAWQLIASTAAGATVGEWCSFLLASRAAAW